LLTKLRLLTTLADLLHSLEEAQSGGRLAHRLRTLVFPLLRMDNGRASASNPVKEVIMTHISTITAAVGTQ
jgi:hypothetical protein